MDRFKCILQRNGVKYRFQVVKTIFAFAKNVKAEVDFAVGEKNQDSGLGFGVWGLGLSCCAGFVYKISLALLLETSVRGTQNPRLQTPNSFAFLSCIEFVADSNGADVIFLFQHFVQQSV